MQAARRAGRSRCAALLAYSTFGNPAGDRAEKVRQAVKILDTRDVDFEYDGEMGADVTVRRYPGLPHTVNREEVEALGGMIATALGGEA